MPAIIWSGICAHIIAEIETRSPVELIAIGIGHDVTRYYRRAVTIVDAEELGGVMTEKLAELFEEDGVPSRSAPGSRVACTDAAHASRRSRWSRRACTAGCGEGRWSRRGFPSRSRRGRSLLSSRAARRSAASAGSHFAAGSS